MPDIFKQDIAGKINKALGPLVFDLTLIKKSVGSRGSDITAGTNPTSSSTSCKGFVDRYKDREIDGTRVQTSDRKISILGASLPSGTVPTPGDQIVAEGQTWVVVENGVDRDPAGAVYECQSR